jgi:hypothetical protein
MSYRDPYGNSYGVNEGTRRGYGENTSYGDPSYSYNNYEPHGTYDQGFDPYRDAGGYSDEPAGQSQGGRATNNQGTKERSMFEKDEPFTAPRSTGVTRSRSKSAATVRSWRYEHQGTNLWTAVRHTLL